MAELRQIFPSQVVRGALLRPDGAAVGLVIGGAPAWDLSALAARGQIGAEYHRLLLALDAPIDVYVVDQPPDVATEIATLLERGERTGHPLLGAVLGEMAEYLTELAQHSGSRAKQVIWAVTASAGPSGLGTGGLDVSSLIRRGKRRGARATVAGSAALASAVAQARRLADALGTLGGSPAPRLMEAEEIARLLYTLADPVRAQRYPLVGTLLDRVRRVVTPR